MSTETPSNRAQLQRRVAALTSERMTLFTQAAGRDGARDAKGQSRLGAIERELDECFGALREHRAVRDAERFSRDGIGFRRPAPRPSGS